VLLVSETGLVSAQGREHLSRLHESVQVEAVADTTTTSGAIARCARDSSRMIVMDGESLVYSLALPDVRPCRITALILHDPALYPQKPAWRSSIKRTLIARARRREIDLVSLGSPGMQASPTSSIAIDPSPFLLVSQSAPSPASAPTAEDGVRWIGIFGGMASRKGSELIIRALSKSPLQNVAIALVGQWPSVKERMAIESLARELVVPIRIRDEYVSTASLRDEMQTVDVVAVLNSNEGSSGIFLAACALSRPVLTSGSQSLKRAALSTGCVWVEPTVEALSDVLTSRDLECFPAPNYQPSTDGQGFLGPLLTGL
jgi:hypothetical protein